MITFRIARYKGKSNSITQYGKHYLTLSNDEKTSNVYCEYNQKHLKIGEKPICTEQNRDLEFGYDFDVDYLYEKEGKLVF